MSSREGCRGEVAFAEKLDNEAAGSRPKAIARRNRLITSRAFFSFVRKSIKVDEIGAGGGDTLKFSTSAENKAALPFATARPLERWINLN